MWMRADGCMSLYLSLVFLCSRLIFPILLLLSPCFLQFLSTSFLLPSPLIRGTPQRWKIIPVRSSESFMSWEDMLVRVLPALFPLYRYLHQLPGPTVSSLFLPPSPLSSLLWLCFHPCLCSLSLWRHIGSAGDVTNTTSLCLGSTNTTQTPGSWSVSRCWSSAAALTAASLFCMLWILVRSPRRNVTSECRKSPKHQLHPG